MNRPAIRPMTRGLACVLLCAPLLATASDTRVDAALALLDDHKCEEAIDAINAGMLANDPKSHFIAGQMFHDGYCVTQNATRSRSLYERGALLGDRDAARTLALIHARGDGVPQSYPQAGRWYSVMRHGGRAAPPGSFAAPETVVQTYIDAVNDLAVELIAYPRDAIDRRVTGAVKVRFDPRVGRVRLVSSTDNQGPTAPEPNRHDFERVLLAAYADALRMLPRPAMSANIDNSTEREVMFDRTVARPDQPAGLQALARQNVQAR